MYERIQRLLRALSTDLHEREDAIRLGLLAAFAGESLFLLGPPGTGKSLIARRLQQAFRDARSFSYLMGRFSTPDEVFGPLSIQALREHDHYERATESYLPDADVVFLDEIWKASPPIQNALLTALNERRFRNGTNEITIPLKVFIGASNELPEEGDEAAAFWDRFLVRLVVSPIADDGAFAALMDETSDPYRDVVPDDLRLTDDEYSRLRTAETTVSIPPNVVALIAAIRASLAVGTDSAPPVYVSDRRWKKIAGLLRMSALLHGRDRVEPIDCAIIRACAWSALHERGRVDEVIARELAARSGRQLVAERLRERLGELQRSHRGLRSRIVEDDRAQPRIYRDEYYRLLPHGETADSYSSQVDEEQLLVWRGDVEEGLRSGPATIDLFVYDADGRLVGSQQSRVAFADEWVLQVDEEEYSVETTVQRAVREEEREPSQEERAALGSMIDALLREIDENIAELADEQTELEDTARRHLFVPVADSEVVLDAIRETTRGLAEVRLLASELARSVAGG